MNSVLNRPSQQVRRELALRERLWGFSVRSRSIGPSQKPQEPCHPAGGSDGRRERITLKLAEGVHPDANRLPRSRVRGERTGGAPTQNLALLFYLSGEPVSNSRLATSASISIVAKVE